MNETLVRFGETLVGRKYFSHNTYSENQYSKVQSIFQTTLFGLEEELSLGVGKEWLCQLKKECAGTSTRSVEVTISTLLLKSWPVWRVEKEFSTTLHMARHARRLVEEKGI